MQKAIAHETVTRKFECPECHTPAFSLPDLEVGRQFGPWYCDNCGWASRGVMTADGCDIELTAERKIDTCVLLQRGELFLVVRGMRFEKKGAPKEHDIEESTAYFYNEHTCPTNFIGGSVEAVIEGEDTDPHGCFTFVAVVDKSAIPPDRDFNGDIDWPKVFKALPDLNPA